ncbi:MAG TPA: hypothetical protein VMR51_02240 [Patescibacteria group bacterium]|nr:hypothetical protein [Patescibacteria group bacterium]
MTKWKQTDKTFVSLAAALLAVCAPMILLNQAFAAPQYTSSSYGIDEVFMGSGGLVNATSASYQGCASLGSTGAGNSGSASYQANAGPCTSPDPYLEFAVTSLNVNLGYLSTSTTTTTTGAFSVRTYLASGYSVINGSDPPKYTSGANSHTLTNLTSPTLSQTGQEQFGINLVANTLPASLGGGVSKDPQQKPSTSYSYGYAATGYGTTNYYKYAKGDSIAASNSSSGETDYTISYIYNITSYTPAGQYAFVHVLICMATF